MSGQNTTFPIKTPISALFWAIYPVVEFDHLPMADLSIIIPFYNEEESVSGLIHEIKAVCALIDGTVEVICIDDGSGDATHKILKKLAETEPVLRIESMGNNQGQAAALRRGFAVANGMWIATLDGDGQNPPAELVNLWRVRESADMIAGRRKIRQDSIKRRIMSRLANHTRRTLLRDGVTDTGCSLKIFKREVTSSFLPIQTMYSFLPAFAVSRGFTVLEIPVEHRPRKKGTSKYGLRAMAIRPFFDMVVLVWKLRIKTRHSY